MPKDNIERAIAKGTGATGLAFQEVLFEAFGPGGVAVLVTAITNNNNRTSQEIRTIFTKAGFQLGAPGSASWTFAKNNDSYIPITTIELSEADSTALVALLEEIDNHDDVQNIFTTAGTA